MYIQRMLYAIVTTASRQYMFDRRLSEYAFFSYIDTPSAYFGTGIFHSKVEFAQCHLPTCR
jgi:hypothetical protein